MTADVRHCWSSTSTGVYLRPYLIFSRLPDPLRSFFAAEINGKLDCKGIAGKKADYDGLYVPPGVHEFRVTVGSGNMQKTSNKISTDFVAEKHLTLKVELRPQLKGSSGALPPSTQVLVTVKLDRFQF
jgi:hypothetical protein